MKYADNRRTPTGLGADEGMSESAERTVPLRSLTGSIKAQKLLREQGIETKVIKPAAKYGGGGCGYGISVSLHQYGEALKVLEDNGITPLRIGR